MMIKAIPNILMPIRSIFDLVKMTKKIYLSDYHLSQFYHRRIKVQRKK